MIIAIFLIIFFGIIAFCIAGSVAMGKQEAEIRKKLLENLNEDKKEEKEK